MQKQKRLLQTTVTKEDTELSQEQTKWTRLKLELEKYK